MDVPRFAGTKTCEEYFDQGVRRLSQRSSGGPARGAIALLSSPVSTQRVRELMSGICGDGALLDECASRSTTHPLGFDKLILLERPDYQLQMHVWWPTPLPRPYEDIHDHRFDFASAVLVGSLLAETFDVRGTGTSMARYTQRSPAGLGRYEFRHTGHVRTRLVHAGMLRAGAVYFLESRMLHRVTVDENDLVATLFLRLRSERDTATVLIDPASPAKPANLPKTRLTREEFSTKVRELGDALDGP